MLIHSVQEQRDDNRSWGEGGHRTHWLVAGLQAQRFLDLVGHELCIFGEVCVPLDSFTTGQLDDLETVVTSVDAPHAGQRAGEEAILEPTRAVLTGLVSLAQLAVDAQRSTEGPAACVAVEIGQPAGLDRVPLIDTHGGVAGRVGTPVALTTFFEEVHQQILLWLFIIQKNLLTTSAGPTTNTVEKQRNGWEGQDVDGHLPAWF